MFQNAAHCRRRAVFGTHTHARTQDLHASTFTHTCTHSPGPLALVPADSVTQTGFCHVSRAKWQCHGSNTPTRYHTCTHTQSRMHIDTIRVSRVSLWRVTHLSVDQLNDCISPGDERRYPPVCSINQDETATQQKLQCFQQDSPRHG